MECNINPGSKIILKLNNAEMYIATYIKGNPNRLQVKNVSKFPTGEELRGVFEYYSSEVLDLKLLNDHNNSTNTKEYSTLKWNEFSQLCSQTKSYIYLSRMDKRYFDGMEYLNSCENVGLLIIGMKDSIFSKISLLVLSAWDQIYIIDLYMFNCINMPEEIKNLLESEYVRKVGHDLFTAKLCLKHCYNIEINNVFDVMVADIVIRKKNGKNADTKSNLPKCISDYFNLPLMDTVMTVNKKELAERPLGPSQLEIAALQVIFLVPLMKKLQVLLLNNFHRKIALISQQE